MVQSYHVIGLKTSSLWFTFTSIPGLHTCEELCTLSFHQFDAWHIFIWLLQISGVTDGIEPSRCLKNRKVNFLLDFEHPETNLNGENPQESKESNLKSLSPLRYESTYFICKKAWQHANHLMRIKILFKKKQCLM